MVEAVDGRSNASPPLGFRHLDTDGVNPNAIAVHLNHRKLKPRRAAQWNRNSVVNVLLAP